MAVSEARKRANRKYDSKAYDSFGVHVRKETLLLERFDALCKATNTSRSAAMIEAMEEYIVNHPMPKDDQ